ncbi:hypothetical protein BT93_B1307 [Corymbia citriodora subsp. variegata]|nr:hypothetical protein BT93_B1307 [Corymbia citriodora subsp. variegata]
MDPRLQQAIQHDDVDELHGLIMEDRKLLDRASKDPFPNTPLHLAATAGKTLVAMELAILKPSFARKLNPEGHSPMHLALQHEQYHTARALMTLYPKLIRARGRYGIAPLHYVLFGWLKRVHLTQILDGKDQDGNTVLHIAASEQQLKVIKQLVGYTTVNAKNFEGKTALEIFQRNPGGDPDIANRLRYKGRPTLSLSKFFSRELTAFERCADFFGVQDESTRNIILIVSTLIAAATYQAALDPPGGYWQNSSSDPTANSTVVAADSSSIGPGKPHQAGEIILSGPSLYYYTISNCLAFFTSIATIWATTFTVEANPLFYIPIPMLCSAYVISLSRQLLQIYARIFPWFLVAFCLLAVLCLPMRRPEVHRHK